MTKKHTYTEIVNKAKTCKTNVEKQYKLGIVRAWVYYVCKAIMKTKTDFEVIGDINDVSNMNAGDHISNQIYKSEYFDMAKRLIKYVETNKTLPNYISIKLNNGKTYKVGVKDYTYMFCRILVYFDKKGAFPKYANVNSKSFTKPQESDNEVYNYFKKVFGDFGDTIDGALSKVEDRGYSYYYDDVYSNKTSIDRMKNYEGINCTDSCHVFYNIVSALIDKGKYKKVECLHVMCSSGGHVKLRITLNDGDRIIRDPACAISANGNGYTCNWCTNDPIAVNPDWFLENLNR